MYPTDGLSSRQYASLAFGLRCREAGFRPSMGSVRDAYGNRLCEIYFATLRVGAARPAAVRHLGEARQAIVSVSSRAHGKAHAGGQDPVGAAEIPRA